MQIFMQIVTFILGLPFQLQKLLQLEEIILACTQALNDYMHAHAWMLLSTKTRSKLQILARFKHGNGNVPVDKLMTVQASF